MAETQLYLGLDLGTEYTQLSYYNMDTREPESVYHDEAKDTYMLPNILFYNPYDRRGGDSIPDCYKFADISGWCAGAKASARRFDEQGVIVDRLYQKAELGESVDIFSRSYKAGELLAKMLVLQIKQFTDRFPEFVIKKLTVTVADADSQIIEAMRSLRRMMQLTKEQFSVVSHLDSCLCYIFAQPETLRNNSVALYDFGAEGLDFYRIDMTRKYPLIISMDKEDYRKRLNRVKFAKNFEDMDEAFAEIAKESLSQTFVSSAFLTGVGFMDDWMKQSASVLCQGRRVFVGQNIYTKGACFRALGGVYTEALDRYFIDTEYTVKTNIGINLMDDKRTFYPIVRGGEEWFNTRGRIEAFLDDSQRLQIVYQDILSEESWYETIEIHGLPKRPAKTTKISIEVEYAGAGKGAIIIRDVGFGELYPSTNKIYRKEFDIAAIKRKHAIKLQDVSQAAETAEGDTDELRREDI